MDPQDRRHHLKATLQKNIPRAPRWLHAGGRTRTLCIGRGLAAGLIFSLLFLALSTTGVLDGLEWMTLDGRFISRFILSPASNLPSINDSSSHSPVTVVAIDERAVAAFGRWPWPRGIQAELVRSVLAAGPAVLGIGIIYSEPASDPRGDRRMAENLKGDVPVVLAAAQGRDGELVPLLSLLSKNVYWGHTDSDPDPDGVVRRLPSEISTSFGTVRTLALEMARHVAAAGDADPKRPPVDQNGRFMVNFRPRRATSTLAISEIAGTISAVDVITGERSSELAGKAVLIGVTARGLESLDQYLTPLRPLGPIPGVYIHAAALASVLEGAYLHRQSEWSLTLMLLLLGAGSGMVAFALRPWPATALMGAGFTLFVAFVVWRFNTADRWIVVAPSVGVMVVAYVAGLWHAHFLVDREVRHIDDTFRRYVAPEVVDTLLAQPSAAEVRGGRRPVTVMFADISGFTAYAERTPPELVVRLLNRYLDLMAESVLLYGGMLDKFVGDGIMALFGAPLPMENHSEAAVRSGLHLLRRVEAMKRPAAKGALSIRIGIHTGEAVVGSVGAATRMEYTAVGDTVNVASRLQEQALPGTLLVSQSTMAALPTMPGVHAELLDPARIRGRREPVQVYQVTPEPVDVRDGLEGRRGDSR